MLIVKKSRRYDYEIYFVRFVGEVLGAAQAKLCSEIIIDQISLTDMYKCIRVASTMMSVISVW